MRLKARVDTNQSIVVAALRNVGAGVQVLSQVGHGCPDILVGGITVTGRRFCCVLEIKSSPKEHLTLDEEAWHAAWPGQVDVVYSPDQAVALYYRLRGMLA